MALYQTDAGDAGIGQIALPITTLTDVYLSNRINQTLYVKAVILCNQGVAGTYRVSYAPLGAADDVSQYIAYDAAINANETLNIADLFGFKGLPLSKTDVLRAYASTANMSLLVIVSKFP